jgi:hypothetical protein
MNPPDLSAEDFAWVVLELARRQLRVQDERLRKARRDVLDAIRTYQHVRADMNIAIECTREALREFAQAKDGRSDGRAA